MLVVAFKNTMRACRSLPSRILRGRFSILKNVKIARKQDNEKSTLNQPREEER